MRKNLALSSILLLVAFGASCKKDEAKPAEPAGEPVAEAPADPVEVSIDAAEAPATGVAEATIAAASDSKVAGTVTFTSDGDKVKVVAKITGLTPGEHGFHVHEKGDCSAPDAKSAGGHFNPASVDHGAHDGEVHHAGDLGNITANAEGVAEHEIEVPTSHLSIAADGANNIVGRAVIVHGGVDDLKSQPSGNAGPRVGCGVIAAKAAE
jgi:Cu-Zn family superoxide dismutase